MKQSFQLPRGLFNRSFLQIVFVGLSLVFLIYFIRNERLQLGHIRQILGNAEPSWLLAGLAITLLYVIFQAWLYVLSFRAIGGHAGFFGAMRLFLKRNFISTFLPAGTFTSLAFFEEELDEYPMTRAHVRQGSFVFALASMTSVLLVAFPVLAMLMVNHQARAVDIYGFIFIFLAILAVFVSGISIRRQRGIPYRLLFKLAPSFVSEMNEVSSQKFRTGTFIGACMVSLGIEAAGVAHLYISLGAVDVAPTLLVSLVGYVIMLILLSVSPFLKGLGAIEISIAYVLTLYGLSPLMAAAVTLLFRIFEFWLPFFLGLLALVMKKGNIILRIFPALFLMLLGIVNIISALTPAIASRLHLMRDFIPLTVLEFSNDAVVLLGVILIICSALLLTGARNAWKLAIVIASLSLVGHLVKAFDFEEALLALFTIGILIYTRRSYFVKHDLRFQLRSVSRIGISIGALFVYVLGGFYLLHKRHLGVEAGFIESVNFTLKSIAFITQDFVPRTATGKYFLGSIHIASAAVVGYVLFVMLKFTRLPYSDPADKENAIRLTQEFGNSSLDYFKTYADKQLFFNDNKSAFLAFAESRNYAVVLEGPVAADENARHSLIQQFEENCLERGVHAFYYRVTDNDLPFYAGINKNSVLIGQEAILYLEEFSLAGGNRKSLRNAKSKIEQSGLRGMVYEPPLKDGLLQRLKAVSHDWLKRPGHDEAGFSQGIFVETEIRSTTTFTIENDEERVLAFTNLIPSFRKGEGTYDLIRHTEDIPNGGLDYLMLRVIEYLKEKGFVTMDFGLVPLAGTEQNPSVNSQIMSFYRDHFPQAGRFKGLYEYKDKFGPKWENRYLIYDQLYDLMRFPAIFKEVSHLLS